MARYIDAVKTAEIISEKFNIPLYDLVDIFAEIPTANAVPKSEYDSLKKLFNDMTQEAKGYLNRLYGIRADVAREIFAEIEKVLGEKYELYVFDNRDIEGIEQDAIIAFADTMKRHFAELKKKYTEGGEC